MSARETRLVYWTLGALLLSAAILLFRTPYVASNLDVETDSVEYAVAAQRLADFGRYDLLLQGQAYPPRYPPWFSALLSPAYLLGKDLGSGIWVVFLLALAGVAAAWSVGWSAGGLWGGLLAGAALLLLHDYRQLGVRIMTDVPGCAFFLCAAALYMSVAGERRPRTRTFVLGGLAAAAAAALRPELAGAVLPFVLAALAGGRRGRGPRLAAAALPAALVALLTATYDWRVFGSPWRSGYNFWCPVPYDYPRLVFSASYLPTNLRVTFGQTFAVVALIGALFCLPSIRRELVRRAEPAAAARLRAGLRFLLWAGLPAAAFHLFYFFPASRFLLAPAALAAALGAGAAGAWLGRRGRRLVPALLALGVAAAGLARLLRPPRPPIRRIRADMMARLVPKNAIVLTELDPVYLEPLLLRGTSRLAMPLGRNGWYSSKLIAPARVPDPVPAPTSPYDSRCPGLLAGGARPAVRFVASERIPDLEKEAAAGTPLFLDAAFINPKDVGTLRKLERRFLGEPAGPAFYRLRPR